jgi:hypothetical protein
MAATDGSSDLIADITAIAQQVATENTDAKEGAAVEIVQLFTARMQHHFARGPFSKELRKRLVADGQNDLAHQAYPYFLAANVIKHGTGASYHELRVIRDLPFAVKQPDGSGTVKPDGLIDVHADGFFDGLVETLTRCHAVLETA